MSTMSNKCGFCSKEASFRCSRCKTTFYCNREHQKKYWKVHKKECFNIEDFYRLEGASKNLIKDEKSSWEIGLGEDKYEWLVNCYRLRADDMYVWRGQLVGSYEIPSTKIKILRHFWVFCKLAVSRKVIPSGWNWSKFLKVAKGLLTYVFDKSDAQEKYGSENVFTGYFGGRSLRYTATDIYKTYFSPLVSTDSNGISACDPKKDEEYRNLEKLSEKFNSARDFFACENVFENVGGIAAWRELHRNMDFKQWVMV